MQDFGARMKEITTSLDMGVRAGGDAADDGAAQAQADTASDQRQLSLEDKELLLEELMDIVSSIDFARGRGDRGGMVRGG